MKQRAWKGVAMLVVASSVAAGLGAFAVTGIQNLVTLSSAGQVVFGSPGTVGNTPILAPPRNQITAGDQALWIDTFQNVGDNVGSGSVTNTFDPKRQQLVAGSFKVPAGWNASYTTDGSTWTGAEPSEVTQVSGVQATAEFTPELGKPGVVTRLSPPSTSTVSTSIAGGGDSFLPIFRKQNVYSLVHHNNVNMTCFNKITGASCGKVKTTSSLLTSDNADAWVDARNGRAYIPATEKTATAENNVVLSCLDLDNKVDCGTIVLDTGATAGTAAYTSEPWSYKNEVYFAYRKNATGALLVACASVPSNKPCAGQPYSAGLPYTLDIGTWSSRQLHTYWSPDGVKPYRTDGKVAYTAVPEGTNFRTLECFDSKTKTACAGVARVGWDNAESPVLHQTANVVDGFCSRDQMTAPVTCFDFLGGSVPVTPGLESWLPKTTMSWVAPLGSYGTAPAGKSLLPQSTYHDGTVLCFDWALDATCPGFPTITPMSRLAYSVRQDPTAPTCVWTMGDDGILETVETLNGMSGCSLSTSTVTPTYCDGKNGHVQGWDQIKLNDLVNAHDGFTLTLRNAAGIEIAGWNLKKYPVGTNLIDISTIPYNAANRSITAEFQFKDLSGAAFDTATPTLEVTWKGDPLQVCSTTRMIEVCPTLFSAIVPNAITRKVDATTVVAGVTDTASVNLAFDSVTPLTCATGSLSVQATVNGERRPTSPGVQVREGSPIEVGYTVRNTGTTLIGSPTLTDDAGTPDPSDDLVTTFVSGDINSNGMIEPAETWIYSAKGDGSGGQHQSHPTITGTELDALGAPIPGATNPVATDTNYYYVAAPAVTFGAGIYVTGAPGASCSTARTSVYAEKDVPITYCYAVTNTGNITLATVNISDLDVGASNANVQVISGSLTNLAPGETVVVTYATTNSSYLVATATVTANPGAGSDVSATATTIRNVGPRIFPPT